MTGFKGSGHIDCSLALQIPVACQGIDKVCFYPPPINYEVLEELKALLDDDLVGMMLEAVTMKSCYKATIPIASVRELVDEDDITDDLSYRCPKCSKCQECKQRNKYHAMSMQEWREKVVREESITLDLEQDKVTVQLPLMRDQVKYLMEKHQSNSNYGQARRAYVSQCWKEPRILAGIRQAHRELLEKGFMVPLNETVRFINESPFRHYYL